MLGRLAELIVFGLTPLIMAGLMLPAAFATEETKVFGEIFYRERIALPDDAVLTVRLVDGVSRNGQPNIVAKQTVAPAGQVPIRFEMKLDPAILRLDGAYVVQAEITVGDVPWFVSHGNETVDPWEGVTKRLVLALVKPANLNG